MHEIKDEAYLVARRHLQRVLFRTQGTFDLEKDLTVAAELTEVANDLCYVFEHYGVPASMVQSFETPFEVAAIIADLEAKHVTGSDCEQR